MPLAATRGQMPLWLRIVESVSWREGKMSGKRVALTALVASVAAACGSKTTYPPRIDLRQHEVIGIIQFASSERGELAALATQRFMEAARRDQGLVRIVELGTEEEVLREVERDRLDAATYRALGEKLDLNTIFTGQLEISDIRPAVRITRDLRNMGVAADVDATLTVNMVETASGASLWSRSGSVTMRVGQVSVLGGRDVVFDAEEPERAYGDLVDALVARVTRDFHFTRG